MRASVQLTSTILLFSITCSLYGQTAASDQRRLDHIKLQLRMIGDCAGRTEKVQFKPDDEVCVQVLALNSGPNAVALIFADYFVGYVPVLSKNGKSVGHSEAMQQRLAASDEQKRHFLDPNWQTKGGIISARLPASTLTEAGLIILDSYYDRLEPGIYEIKVKYRELNGAEIESDPVMFEVIP